MRKDVRVGEGPESEKRGGKRGGDGEVDGERAVLEGAKLVARWIIWSA